MTTYDRLPLRELDEDAALRTILEGTATETRHPRTPGREFMKYPG
jgi:hypothetical protein